MDVCGSCGSKSIYLKRKNSSMVGLYCGNASCQAWQKWVGKKDIEGYQRKGIKVQGMDFTLVPEPTILTSTSSNFGVTGIDATTGEIVSGNSAIAVAEKPVSTGDDCGCASCGNEGFFLRRKNANMVGQYCDRVSCQAWLKWVAKKDLGALERRGYKVHPVNYELPSNTESVEMLEDDLPDFGMVDNEEELISVSEEFDEFVEEPEVSYAKKELMASMEQVASESIKTICTTCATGVMESMQNGADVTGDLYGNMLLVYNRAKTNLIASFRINHCPECGKSLK